MITAVVGGTGHVGSFVVAELAARGDTVRILSRGAPARLPDGDVEHRAVDLAGGAGLADALDGVEVVVNAVGDPRGRTQVLVEGTRRLLAAEARAGVGHHVAISILGTDRSSFGFHKATLAQEQVVAGGPVPWSVVRATQFHTLVGQAFAFLAGKRLLPSGEGRVQPIDPAVVASWLADAAHGEPAGRLPDIAGPEVLTVSQLAAIWRERHPGRYLPLPTGRLGALGRALRDGVLIDPGAAVEGPTFAQWLDRTSVPVARAASVR
jgi:uncharacterized protein YbjT (DUF2867 family)